MRYILISIFVIVVTFLGMKAMKLKHRLKNKPLELDEFETELVG